MLVAISDIHFVDGTAGEHNLPYGAFQSVFLSNVASLIKAKKAKNLKILLLGDIIDLIRSTKWLETREADRPWGSKGILDIPVPQKNSKTEKICLEILGQASDRELEDDNPPEHLPENTILHKNWKTFKLFRNFKEHLDGLGVKLKTVEVIYIPGNHDRMCNLYPSLRELLRKYFGLTLNDCTVDGDPNGVWQFKNEYTCEEHGLIARHGHQYDIWNFADIRNLTDEGYFQVPIGDVLTTEFAVKIPWLLNSPQIHQKYKVPPNVIETAQDIDNVRPISAIMEWLYYKLKNDYQGGVKKAFDEVFKKIVADILKNKLVQQWRCPQTYLDEALRAASSPWLHWLSGAILDMLKSEDLLPILMAATDKPTRPADDVYLKAAFEERLWKNNPKYQYVFMGHTHNPMYYALDGNNDREVLYINTGTWRNRINKTVCYDNIPDFVKVKEMTFCIICGAEEDTDNKVDGTLSFDMWTGMKKKKYVK